MPNSSIADRLASLAHLSKPALSELWQQLFGKHPPPRIRKDLLLRFVGYRVQEQEFGGLSDGTLRRLRELSKTIDATSDSSTSRRLAIKPGTRLIRQWKDRVHVVNVEEGSYEYKGARYESLSEIARLITGTRWSGPLFFGLKTKAKNSRRQNEFRS